MYYKIIENPDYTNYPNIGIEIYPDNRVLKFFIASLKLKEFPKYISQLAEGINFGVENASFIFYEQMDWEDKAEFFKNFKREILKDEIEIYLYDGRTNYSAVKVKDFLQIFYDYSEKVLEINLDNKEFPTDWSQQMKESLEKLKEKIGNENINN